MHMSKALIKRKTAHRKKDRQSERGRLNNHEEAPCNGTVFLQPWYRETTTKPYTYFVVYHIHCKKSMEELKIMRRLTLKEFSESPSLSSVHKYILFSDNQKWRSIDDIIRFDIVFSDISIGFNPNTVSFKNGSDCVVSLQKIKFVTLDENSVIGTVFTFVCESQSESPNHNKYTFVFQ